MVTVNSDNPAYFGGHLNDNLLALFRACPSLKIAPQGRGQTVVDRHGVR